MNKEGFFQPGQYASIPKALLADTDVGLAAKLVYLGLQSYLDADKAQAWPGAADLQRRTGLSRRAVQQGIIRKGRTGEADAGRPDDKRSERNTLGRDQLPRHTILADSKHHPG